MSVNFTVTAAWIAVFGSAVAFWALVAILLFGVVAG